MQKASVLKPYALSLLLLPSADTCFTCQWSQLVLLTGLLPVSAWKIRKNLQCWQVFYLSGNEIFFFRKIFIFRYHWQVKYLSAIKSFNRSLRFFLVLTGVLPVSDQHFMFFLIVWQVFYLSVITFDIHWQVLYLSVIIFYLLTGGLPVSVIEILFDRWFTCQWWILAITDRWFTCQ